MITKKSNLDCKAKPIMKWAGGKTQLLSELLPLVPDSYGKYIEPFFGGGALFFALAPSKAVIADSNPELVNLYRQVANDVDNVVKYLSQYRNDKDEFLEIRALRWESLTPSEAAEHCTIFCWHCSIER